MMRSVVNGLFSLLMVGLVSSVFPVQGAEQSRPNIVFMLIDDMGFMDIACNGSRYFETPHIDRLASQGMRFTDGYAACPVCSPTRLSIMAGKYPARVQLTNFIAGDRWPDNSPLMPLEWRPFMAPEEITLAETLKSNGYTTACLGKWHLNLRDNKDPRFRETMPKAQGFDVVVDRVENQTDKSVSGLTDRAIEFITDHREKPFFVYLCHHSVHIPLEATPDLIEKYQRRIEAGDPQNNPIYGGMVETVDRSMGRIMATLDELQLADNTILVFFSDNGGLSVIEGDHTPATSNAPLRGGKGHVYDGGTRVPFIIRWPGVVAPSTTCSVPVSSVDFYPTFLEAVKATPPAGQVLDGESIMPLLTGSGDLQRKAIFWHYPHYSNQGGLPGGAVREGNFKLVELYEEGRLELYDLKNDPGEQQDLAEVMPEKVTALHQQLKDWRKSVGAHMPQRNSNYDPTRPRYSDPAKAPQSWRAAAEAVLAK